MFTRTNGVLTTQIPVKHEIFLGDVTSCFTALKKAVQDFHAMSMAAESLQMGNPSVRSVSLRGRSTLDIC